MSNSELAMAAYEIANLGEIDPVKCPCGLARRAFAGVPGGVATMHYVEIHADAQVHYHKKMTELYLVLEGEGQIELDGKSFPLLPMMAVMIRPFCRHRAVGKLCIINVAIPAFDPADEWFD
jgi:quercetin dioxygenase-like cupin family protein